MWNKARNGIKILMTPGPVEVSPRVLSALAEPAIYHYYQGFVDFFEETSKKMARVFQTRKSDVLILQGEGVLGLEAAVACTVNPEDKVIVFENGPFGKGFGQFVENAGGTPAYFHADTRDLFDAEAALTFLEENRDAVAITMVHCETPAGILNPLGEICRKAQSLGILVIVDCVASLGGTDVRPDDLGIDMCVTASQKCISSTSGLTPMTMSKFAWEKVEKKKQPLKSSYLSLLDWRNTWLSSKRFPFTPLTAEVYALSAALDEILEEGIENVFKRHDQVSRYCRERAEELGLKLWPRDEKGCSPTVTALSIPEKWNDVSIINAVAEKYGILIGGGYRELKGQVLRIGHMGYQAQRSFVSATMDALEDVLGKSKPYTG